MNSQESTALQALIDLSNHYGIGNEYVIAGGGNTSWKNDRVLFVKGSGQALSTIKAEGFAHMDRQALAAIWTAKYPDDNDEREKQVLAALMAARLPGEEQKRPSVETLMHDLLPFPFVVHTHPGIVNAITCAKGGKAAFDKLFAQEAIWVPLVNPGYILSKVIKDAMEAFQKKHQKIPAIIFMQNHGIVVAGQTPEAIQADYERIFGIIRANLRSQADLTVMAVNAGEAARFLDALEPLAREKMGSDPIYAIRSTEKTVLGLAADDRSFAVISSAFSPDHIVYMGISPIRVDRASDLPQAFAEYQAKYGKPPRVVLAKGLGAWCLGNSEKSAGQAHQLFLDEVKIAVATASFGGPEFMGKEFIDFIRNWEVEAYRAKVSSGT